MIKSLILPIALALSGIAAAQEPVATARVSYVDLNLRTPAGVRTLDRRLARAVRSVCPSVEGTILTAHKVAARRCLVKSAGEAAKQRGRVLAASATPDTVAYAVR